jgi:hypothetical protein
LIMAVILLILCFAIIGLQALLVVALILSLATFVFPKAPAAWALAAMLAIFALDRFGAAPGWKFFVVLAGAHALHICGMTLGWLPLRGHVQTRVFGRIVRRFLVIQIPAQLASFIVLSLLAGHSVAAALTSPVFGIMAGIGFVLLVVLAITLSRASSEPGTSKS